MLVEISSDLSSEGLGMEEKLPTVIVDLDQCKGCRFCVDACKPNVLSLQESFNRLGYQFAVYKGTGCTGCEACFYVCPEPGAITVIKEKKRAAG